MAQGSQWCQQFHGHEMQQSETQCTMHTPRSRWSGLTRGSVAWSSMAFLPLFQILLPQTLPQTQRLPLRNESGHSPTPPPSKKGFIVPYAFKQKVYLENVLIRFFYFEHISGTAEHLVRLDISRKNSGLSTLNSSEKTHTENDSCNKDMSSPMTRLTRISLPLLRSTPSPRNF